MYAVLETGSKQFRVSYDEIIRVERLKGLDVGDMIEFNNVLAISEGDKIKIGSPYIEGAKVVGEIVAQAKSKKILVFKKKRRKKYRKLLGHRQLYTAVKIKTIVG